MTSKMASTPPPSKNGDDQELLWHNGRESPRTENARLSNTPRQPPTWNTDHSTFDDDGDLSILQPNQKILLASNAMKDLPWLMRVSQRTTPEPNNENHNNRNMNVPSGATKTAGTRIVTNDTNDTNNNNKKKKKIKPVYNMHLSTEGIAHLVLSEQRSQTLAATLPQQKEPPVTATPVKTPSSTVVYTIQSGDTVEAQCQGWSKHYKGVVTKVHNNGTYDIKFEDGEQKNNVPAQSIKPFNIAGPKASSSPVVPKLNLSKTSQIQASSKTTLTPPATPPTKSITTIDSNEYPMMGTWNGRSVSMDTTIIVGSPRMPPTQEEDKDTDQSITGSSIDLRTSGTRIRAYLRKSKTVNSKFGETKSIGTRSAAMKQRQYDDHCSTAHAYIGERPVLQPRSPRKRARMKEEEVPYIPTEEEEEEGEKMRSNYQRASASR